jgi:hypothetical protein
MTRLKAVRLSPSDPHSALRRSARQMPARHAAPRRLSEQQLKNPLIRTAFDRLGNIVSYRGQFLRRLDGVHGDRRTRLEKFVAIERVAEQLLLRLDLATSVLGYIDPTNGRYVLNTQCGIALDAAGYVFRRRERIRLDERDANGLHLVRTRVLVRFTKLFWKDLGLAYVFERVQKAAKKRRDAQLRDMGQARLAEMEKHSLELKRREVSRQRWQAKEAREMAPTGPIESPAGRSPQPTARKVGGDVMGALGRLASSLANKAQ